MEDCTILGFMDLARPRTEDQMVCETLCVVKASEGCGRGSLQISGLGKMAASRRRGPYCTVYVA